MSNPYGGNRRCEYEKTKASHSSSGQPERTNTKLFVFEPVMGTSTPANPHLVPRTVFLFILVLCGDPLGFCGDPLSPHPAWPIFGPLRRPSWPLRRPSCWCPFSLHSGPLRRPSGNLRRPSFTAPFWPIFAALRRPSWPLRRPSFGEALFSHFYNDFLGENDDYDPCGDPFFAICGDPWLKAGHPRQAYVPPFGPKTYQTPKSRF